MARYHEIYDSLLEKIQNGEYTPGDLLPGEHQLEKIYDVSRDTVRKALLMLSQNGYIQKTRGRGTTVISVNPSVSHSFGLDSFDERFQREGHNTHTRVYSLKKIQPDRALSKAFSIGSTEKLWRIVRTRSIERTVVGYEVIYLDSKLFPEMDRDNAKTNFLDLLPEDTYKKVAYNEIVVTCSTHGEADEDDEFLETESGKPVMNTVTCTYLDTAKMFMMTTFRERGDYYETRSFIRNNPKV